MKLQLALVGDYSPEVTAHCAIPRALELACAATTVDLTWQWIATRDIRDAARDLAEFSAVWLVPASPYENMAGAIDAVRFARETKRPFLGTCGGLQHALIEFARNVAGLTAAGHAETNPTADTLVVAPMACSLVEKTGLIRFTPGSLVRAAYGRDEAHESYHCSYGLNPTHRVALERAGLRFTAFDENDEVRAAELPVDAHPFFVGTLFQPERAALRDEAPPIVRAFVAAAAKRPAR
jgi:CTP synthase (UTP-ammonia lyase)